MAWAAARSALYAIDRARWRGCCASPTTSSPWLVWRLVILTKCRSAVAVYRFRLRCVKNVSFSSNDVPSCCLRRRWSRRYWGSQWAFGASTLYPDATSASALVVNVIEEQVLPIGGGLVN